MKGLEGRGLDRIGRLIGEDGTGQEGQVDWKGGEGIGLEWTSKAYKLKDNQ